MNETAMFPAMPEKMEFWRSALKQIRERDDHEAPPGSAHLPVEPAPHTKCENHAGRGNQHANGSQGIGRPCIPKNKKLAVNSQAARRDQECDTTPERNGSRSMGGLQFRRLNLRDC